jgi:hypothetical protein
VLVVVRGVAPTKGNLLVGQGDESVVGDGDAMGVAAQILEHILGATEGWLGVDHPMLSEKWTQPRSEDFGLSEECQIPRKAELTVLEGGLETGDELAAKNPTKHRDGEKEARARWNPAGVIERQPPGGDDAMDMGVKFDLLIPGVQHGEEADLGTEMSGSASDFEESFCTGPEQQPIEELRVL